MKLWKIMLAVIVAVLMISCVAMADSAECEHEIVAISYVPTGTVYQIPGENEHTVAYNVTYACKKCNAPATYSSKVEYYDEYCVYSKNGAWVAATCTDAKYRLNSCVCGATQKETSGEALGHNTPKTQLTKGDCQTRSTWAYVCINCGKQFGDTWEGSFGTHVLSTSKQDPTCTKDGWKYETCTVKGCSYENDTVIPADGKHRWDYAKSEVVAPTCTTAGYTKVPCMDCGYVTGKTEAHEAVAALGHDYKFHAAVEAKCNKEGCEAYWTCNRCAKMFKGSDANVEIYAIPTIPVNVNGHEVTNGQWNYVISSCTASDNYKTGICVICGKVVKESVPAAEHKYPTGKQLFENEALGGVELWPTCTKEGKGWVNCTVCAKQAINVVIPAKGHYMSYWTYSNPATCTTAMIATRACYNNCGYTETEVLAEALGHNWKVVDKSSTATCDKAGVCSRLCTNCGIVENNVAVPALGHAYEEKVTAATCTKDGKVVKTCKVCGDKKTEKIPAAHGATKEVAGKAAACGVAGTIDVICTVCDAKVGEKATAALAHSYSWVVVTKPSEAGNGRNEYKCGLCGDVAEVKTIKFSKMYYNNTMTSFGPTTKELVGGNDWYRVTPVDLTVDGVYTYDLIASNKYIVGKVTITVNAGTLTVSYKANGVDVKDEALLIYASKADLATGTAVTAPVGAAINAAETFGADTKVLVSLILTGDYDAAGKGLVDASAAAGMIANID